PHLVRVARGYWATMTHVRRWLIVACATLAGGRASADTPEEVAARGEAERACAARAPACDWVIALGAPEQQSVRRAPAARRLHDPLYSSVVAAIPVKASDPNKVALLVVTRDIFSLRFNSSYTFQSGTLTNLNVSLSENNFLGTRDLFAAAMTMDMGALRVGP